MNNPLSIAIYTSICFNFKKNLRRKRRVEVRHYIASTRWLNQNSRFAITTVKLSSTEPARRFRAAISHSSPHISAHRFKWRTTFHQTLKTLSSSSSSRLSQIFVLLLFFVSCAEIPLQTRLHSRNVVEGRAARAARRATLYLCVLLAVFLLRISFSACECRRVYFAFAVATHLPHCRNHITSGRCFAFFRFSCLCFRAREGKLIRSYVGMTRWRETACPRSPSPVIHIAGVFSGWCKWYFCAQGNDR